MAKTKYTRAPLTAEEATAASEASETATSEAVEMFGISANNLNDLHTYRYVRSLCDTGWLWCVRRVIFQRLLKT